MDFRLGVLVYSTLLTINVSFMKRLVFLQKHKRTERRPKDLLARTGDYLTSQCLCGSEHTYVHMHLLSVQEY